VAGPTINYRLAAGELELAASGSSSTSGAGAAVAAGYAYLGRPVTLSARLRSMTADYSTLSVHRPDDRVRLEASGMIATQVGRWATVSLQQSTSETHAGTSRSQTTATATIALGARLNLFVNAAHSRDGSRRTTDLYAGVSIPIAARTSASVWAHGGDGQAGASADLQRALPVGTGYGYRARAALGGTSQAEMMLEAQSRYGRYEAGTEVLDGQQSAHVSVNGGLVAIGGRVMPTRAVVDSFALVRVPDVGGVRTYLNNQEVGRTNGRGDLLMSNLLPYYANRVSIADQDVPIERELDTVDQAIAPPFRGGSLVTFRANERRTITGTALLAIGSQSVVPALGELSVSIGNESLSSPIGHNGEFYLEGVQAGRHPAVVVSGATTCRFELTVPASNATVLKLGIVRCVVPEVK
jgi:outer membrane usher protein